MKLRPSLLLLCAGAAGLSAVANAVSQPSVNAAANNRLSASVRDDMTAAEKAASARKRQLSLQEQVANAAAQRLKAAAASSMSQPVVDPRQDARDDEERRFEDLAKIYQAMKPKAAAAVFEQLALDVQVKVAERMRERATAQIMSAMTPKGAAALTMAIARRQSGYTVLPQPAGANLVRPVR